MQTHRYPADWVAIATAIKAANDWQCQSCGRQCRRPGEPFDSHTNTLTVAHLEHNPDAAVVTVAALCAPCHLRYDATAKAARRKAKLTSQATQITLPFR